MPWRDRVGSIVEAWYPGEEGGAAIADVLSGAINPSAKLPVTFPASDSQIPTTTPRQYPGVNGIEHYSEGLEVGYRWQDARQQTPLFPFGFGLSYTHFEFSGMGFAAKPDGSVDVSAAIKNVGAREGAEVAQLYLQYPKEAGEPPFQLRGFQKVRLAPGHSTTIHFHLDRRAFSVWSGDDSTWRPVAGEFTLAVGDSSRSLTLQKSLVYP
jgi:beta-glucosidase